MAELIKNRKVTFNPDVEVLTIYEWPFAYAEARKSNWLQIVADRFRFQRRINEMSETLSPVLTDEHRKKIADRIKLSNSDKN